MLFSRFPHPGFRHDIMALDPTIATAADYDAIAKRNANGAWLAVIVTAVCFFFGGWIVALLPALIALWFVLARFGCRNQAAALRNGTYPIPNPNNGKK